MDNLAAQGCCHSYRGEGDFAPKLLLRGEGLGVQSAGESWEVVRLVDSDLADHRRALLKKKGLPNPPESVWQELLESFEG